MSCLETGRTVDKYNDDSSHVYGAFGKKNCITTGQPGYTTLSRWFDMPCAYLDVGNEENLTSNLPNVTPVRERR